MTKADLVFLLVEGQTEKALADMILAPAAAKQDVVLKTKTVITSATLSGSHRGEEGWKNYDTVLRGLLRNSHFRRIGLLIDYHQYPSGAPGPNAEGHGVHQEKLIDTLRAQYRDPRFRPLVVLHEIEALVLAAVDAGHGDKAIKRQELAALRRAITAAGGPEFVNNGTDTAPSKRLMKADPHYIKDVTGPDLVAQAGLDAILERCPTFAAWWRNILSRPGDARTHPTRRVSVPISA